MILRGVKIRHLRWYVAGLLFLSTVINYIDRQTLSIIAPVVSKELGISAVEYANILQAFLIAYTVMYLISGILVDRWGTRTALSAFMAWWSASNVLHALASSAAQLGAFRFLLGVGEPGNFMAAIRATSEWFPAKERAFVNGLVNAGAAVGAIIAAPLVAFLTLAWGWRAAFVITGSFGFVWLIGWLFLYRLPRCHPNITDEELLTIEAGQPASTVAAESRMKWKHLLQHRQTWGLLLARFISDPVWWFYLFWLPKYLVEQRGFTMSQVGQLAWLPYLFADIGSVAGGLASGYLIKRNWNVQKARNAAMLPCALVMPLSLLIAFTPASWVALSVICVVTFAHMAWKTNLVTVTNDLYPVSVVGSVSGIVAFGSGLGGTLFTNLTGHIVQNFSYEAIFIVMGFLHPAGYLIYRVLVRGPIASTAPGTAPASLPGTSAAAG
jgi:Sugar phosphate permease